MEKGEMKIPIVEEGQTSKSAWRFVGILSGAVTLLAVAFIVLIACTMSVLQHKSCDEDKAVVETKPEHAEKHEYPIKNNGTLQTESVIVYPGSRMEYIVTRNAQTGHVESVVTIDYNTEQTTVYAATLNTCFLARGHIRDFEDAVDSLNNNNDGAAPDSAFTMSFDVSDQRASSDEIPAQMAPFCTPSNSLWLKEHNEDDERVRRDSVYFCYYCTPMGMTYTTGGVTYYVYWCLYWFDASRTCNDPITDVYEDYGLRNGNTLHIG